MSQEKCVKRGCKERALDGLFPELGSLCRKHQKKQIAAEPFETEDVDIVCERCGSEEGKYGYPVGADRKWVGPRCWTELTGRPYRKVKAVKKNVEEGVRQ
jgi:hypothetical protein